MQIEKIEEKDVAKQRRRARLPFGCPAAAAAASAPAYIHSSSRHRLSLPRAARTDRFDTLYTTVAAGRVEISFFSVFYARVLARRCTAYTVVYITFIYNKLC